MDAQIAAMAGYAGCDVENSDSDFGEGRDEQVVDHTAWTKAPVQV